MTENDLFRPEHPPPGVIEEMKCLRESMS